MFFTSDAYKQSIHAIQRATLNFIIVENCVASFVLKIIVNVPKCS